MSIKGQRRMSSLRDGTPAYPHISVPDQHLYRHLSDQMPPVVRMKMLLNWALHRSMAQALGEEPMPKPPGKSSTRQKELALLDDVPARVSGVLTDQETQKFAEAAPMIRKVIDDTLRDLNDGLIGISWLHQSREKGQSLQPHPRNESNKQASEQREGMLALLRDELAAWEEQEKDVDRIHTEADALDKLHAEVREPKTRRKGRASAADELDEDQGISREIELALMGQVPEDVVERELAWTVSDLDAETREQLELAEDVLRSVDELQEAVVAKRNGSTPATQVRGTESDARLDALEFSVDKIGMRLHAMAQLDEVAQAYLGQVATRASQALQERTAAGTASFAGLGSVDGDGEQGSAAAQERLDTVLAGIREPSEAGLSDAPQAPADTRDLLRALAQSRK